MNVTGRLYYMLVENSSDGQVISKYLIEVSNRTATTADELLLHMFHSDHKELFLIPDSMVKFAQAALEKDYLFDNFRHVIKDSTCYVLTKQVLLEMDEENFIRSYIIEKMQEAMIMKKLFSDIRPSARLQKCVFSSVSNQCRKTRSKRMKDAEYLYNKLSSDLETSINEVNHFIEIAR